ncbi:MAG: hypothetical protein JSV03_02650 [Planctomycetota bacterium]|nr:MAG: hypothetical protein JSV03_02650 [Planctomycetota bacterium]
MAKSKHAPALFEVIETDKSGKDSGGKLAVPKWWKSGQKAKSAPPPAPKKAPAERTTSDPDIVPPRTSTASATPRADSGPIEITDQPRPLFQMRGGRIEISLNPVSSFVVATVLVVLIVASYQIGTMVGGPAKRADSQADAGRLDANNIDDALKRPANSSVLDVGPTALIGDRSNNDQGGKSNAHILMPRSSSAAITAKTGKRVPGLTYVVLESFKPQHYKQAEHAQNWFSRKKNVITTLEKKGDRWVLISVDGFESRKKAQPYREGIIAMGAEYFREFRGKADYNFRDPALFTE